jgi:hypothetical protein
VDAELVIKIKLDGHGSEGAGTLPLWAKGNLMGLVRDCRAMLRGAVTRDHQGPGADCPRGPGTLRLVRRLPAESSPTLIRPAVEGRPRTSLNETTRFVVAYIS